MTCQYIPLIFMVGLLKGGILTLWAGRLGCSEVSLIMMRTRERRFPLMNINKEQGFHLDDLGNSSIKWWDHI